MLNEDEEKSFMVESQHHESNRVAVVEDDGISAWLYLTEKNSRKPVADIWIYNRIPAPDVDQIKNYQGGPPPAAKGYTQPLVIDETPLEEAWGFVWSKDGDSVLVHLHQTPTAMIIQGEKSGYCKDLLRNGPWGKVWDEKVAEETFSVGE